jgi:hypothetical protein
MSAARGGGLRMALSVGTPMRSSAAGHTVAVTEPERLSSCREASHRQPAREGDARANLGPREHTTSKKEGKKWAR